ncbi:hypothetical protein [Paraburkholderia gardini]|uniref:hypothetical protein n=1 Tax=Paraburkholderia gardini TaxID=2823469 RepID=UPI001D8EB246|nr:hypothetical protein [Paraburkholderia gardini]CAG4900264.1 hypothetical protein R69919_02723 [Paraburkholderia gardini]
MPFRTSFFEFVYADETGAPCALRYRIAFTDTTERLAVIHLLHTDPEFTSPVDSAIARDNILNRIVDSALPGIPVNALRLVVEDARGAVEYAIEADIDDYIRRGNPYESGQVKAAGSRVRESISIRSESIIAGRTRVQTVHATPSPASEEVTHVLG